MKPPDARSSIRKRTTARNPIQISPGPGGAHNWSPMSFNPATGLVYIPTATSTSFSYTVQSDFNYKPGQQNMGIVFGGFGGSTGPGPCSEAPAGAFRDRTGGGMTGSEVALWWRGIR